MLCKVQQGLSNPASRHLLAAGSQHLPRLHWAQRLQAPLPPVPARRLVPKLAGTPAGKHKRAAFHPLRQWNCECSSMRRNGSRCRHVAPQWSQPHLGGGFIGPPMLVQLARSNQLLLLLGHGAQAPPAAHTQASSGTHASSPALHQRPCRAAPAPCRAAHAPARVRVALHDHALDLGHAAVVAGGHDAGRHLHASPAVPAGLA